METKASSLMSFYNRNLLITSSESLAQLASRISIEGVSNVTRALESTEPIDIEKQLWELSPEAHIRLWEESFVELLSNPSVEPRMRDRLQQVVDRHKYLYVELNIPYSVIRQARLDLEKVGKGPGRKPKVIKPKIREISNDEPYVPHPLDPDVNKRVIIHWLPTAVMYKRSEYNVMPDWMNIKSPIRLLHLGETPLRWRNVDEIENKVYNEYAQLYTKEAVTAPFRRKGVYGISMNPMGYNKDTISGYWISDRRDDMGEYSSKSGRDQNRGRRCKSEKDTLGIIWFIYREINIPTGSPLTVQDRIPVEIDELPSTITISMMKERIMKKLNLTRTHVDSFSNEKIEVYYALIIFKNIDDLCSIILNRLRALNLIIDL
jgi:hypothetical protein